MPSEHMSIEYELSSKILLALRQHVDEFSCRRGDPGNITWGIRYAIGETGLYERNFHFINNPELYSQEVKQLCVHGVSGGIIAPVTQSLEGALFSEDLVGYRFTISKEQAKRELKEMRVDENHSTFAEKIAESLQNPSVNPSLPRVQPESSDS